MNSGPAKRADRVAGRLRAELMDLLLRGDIRDPGVSGAFVTGVRMSDDLRHARVYVRTSHEASALQREALLGGLQRATGFIRRALSPKLKLKYIPDFKFFWDEGVDHAARVEQLLGDIEAEAAEDSGSHD